jgi:hypothetical protein
VSLKQRLTGRKFGVLGLRLKGSFIFLNPALSTRGALLASHSCTEKHCEALGGYVQWWTRLIEKLWTNEMRRNDE